MKPATRAAGVEPQATTTNLLLETLIDEVRQLRAAVERQGRAPSLGRIDLETLATLLPAIDATLGDHPFVAREIVHHRTLRPLTRNLSVKGVGRLLARADRIAVDGLAVERIGTETNATLWRVRTLVSSVSHPHEPPATDADAIE